MPESKSCTFETVPSFLVPLRTHSSPESYECYMSCAVKGNPAPHVTWYRNNISINTNTNYFISNTCGVCSMLILRVGPKDNGEYKVIAENQHGRAECSTKLTVHSTWGINLGRWNCAIFFCLFPLLYCVYGDWDWKGERNDLLKSCSTQLRLNQLGVYRRFQRMFCSLMLFFIFQNKGIGDAKTEVQNKNTKIRRN